MQSWDARDYAENARFVAELGSPLIDLLAPRAGERILDIGCGDGALTVKLAQTGAAVVGIDSSAALVAAARAAGVDARVMDGRELAFTERFDGVFSNAALHWMLEPERVLAGVRRALRPHGRFVGELGGFGNVAAIRTALAAVLTGRGLAVASPWYFPTPQAYADLLASHGFAVSRVELIPRPTPLPAGLPAWLNTFANPFLAGVAGAERDAILTEVATLLEPILREPQGRWIADYVRLRFVAARSD